MKTPFKIFVTASLFVTFCCVGLLAQPPVSEKSVLDLAPATPVDPIIATAAKLPQKGASVLVLLDEERRVVYPDYTSLARYHIVAKAFDAKGVAELLKIGTGASSAYDRASLERTRVLKADGRIQEVKSEGDSKFIAGLAPGDILDIAYRIENRHTGAPPRQFTQYWSFANQDIAVLQSRLVLITPRDMAYATRDHGPVPAPKVRESGNWKICEWTARDIPAAKREYAAPPYNEWGTWVDISSTVSWNTVARWYREVSRPFTIADATVRAKALALTKNINSEEGKIRVILNFVSSIKNDSTPFNKSTFVPIEGKIVLRDNRGQSQDKAALLSALLGVIGVKCDMVLLSPRRAGLMHYLPTPRFRRIISRLHTSRGETWVDTCNGSGDFDDLPHQDQGVPALIVDNATTALITTPVLPAEKTSHGHEATRATLGADGKLQAVLRMWGLGKSGFRSRMLQTPTAGRPVLLKKTLLTLRPGSRYLAGWLENLDNAKTPVAVNLKYSQDHFGKVSGGSMLTTLPWIADRPGQLYEDQKKRKTELDTDFVAGISDRSVEMKLPAGYILPKALPGIRRGSRWGSYSYAYRLKGDILVARSRMVFRPLRVPAAEVEACLQWLRGYDTERKRQIVLRRK